MIFGNYGLGGCQLCDDGVGVVDEIKKIFSSRSRKFGRLSTITSEGGGGRVTGCGQRSTIVLLSGVIGTVEQPEAAALHTTTIIIFFSIDIFYLALVTG